MGTIPVCVWNFLSFPSSLDQETSGTSQKASCFNDSYLVFFALYMVLINMLAPKVTYIYYNKFQDTGTGRVRSRPNC
jgi:hypothetical protein